MNVKPPPRLPSPASSSTFLRQWISKRLKLPPTRPRRNKSRRRTTELGATSIRTRRLSLKCTYAEPSTAGLSPHFACQSLMHIMSHSHSLRAITKCNYYTDK